MARRQEPVVNGCGLFDVVDEDGPRGSNSKVPSTWLGGLNGDEPTRAWWRFRT